MAARYQLDTAGLRWLSMQQPDSDDGDSSSDMIMDKLFLGAAVSQLQDDLDGTAACSTPEATSAMGRKQECEAARAASTRIWGFDDSVDGTGGSSGTTGPRYTVRKGGKIFSTGVPKRPFLSMAAPLSSATNALRMVRGPTVSPHHTWVT